LKIGGLISGLDTDTLIQQLMAIERRPVLLMQKRQDTMKTCQTAWSGLKVKLNDFKTAIADLKLAATFSGRVVESGDEQVVTAEAQRAATPGQYAVSITKLARAHKVASDHQASASTPLGLTGTFYVNASPVTVAAGDSLLDIRDAVNAAGAGAVATVVDDTLVIGRSETGATEIAFVDDAATDILTTLGVLDAADGVKHELVVAQDASFTVDGLPITRSSNTVSDVIPDVTLHLAGASTGDVTLTVKADVDAAVTKVKAFIEKYNAALAAVAGELAPDGHLRGDTTLVGMQVEMRKAVSQAVAGLPSGYDRLSAVGITPSGTSGTLVLDEAKFRESFAADPAATSDLFGADSESTEGVATRLYDILNGLTRTAGIIPTKDTSLGRQISDLAQRISAFEKHLEASEAVLTSKFRQMEIMMSSLKNQSGWLDSYNTKNQ
jgi:flagellar hook-associated protein 2